MADFSQTMKIYRVRIMASSGQSERTIQATSTMDAYRQALAEYSPEVILYSLSVRPNNKQSSERLAA